MGGKKWLEICVWRLGEKGEHGVEGEQREGRGQAACVHVNIRFFMLLTMCSIIVEPMDCTTSFSVLHSHQNSKFLIKTVLSSFYPAAETYNFSL